MVKAVRWGNIWAIYCAAAQRCSIISVLQIHDLIIYEDMQRWYQIINKWGQQQMLCRIALRPDWAVHQGCSVQPSQLQLSFKGFCMDCSEICAFALCCLYQCTIIIRLQKFILWVDIFVCRRCVIKHMSVPSPCRDVLGFEVHQGEVRQRGDLLRRGFGWADSGIHLLPQGKSLATPASVPLMLEWCIHQLLCKANTMHSNIVRYHLVDKSK